MSEPRMYETLGDIAAELRVMKADGMTLQSLRYAIERVYGDEIAEESRRRRVMEGLRSPECECTDQNTPTTAPADDVREALVSELRQWAALIGTEPRGARELFTRAADALAEVRPRGTVTDAEVEAAARAMSPRADRWADFSGVARTALEAARASE